MNEFELIQSYLAGLAGPEGLGLLDDVALWMPPHGMETVISTDTLVEGVHFLNGKFDSELAQKLIRSNVSDIVAKGSDPLGYMLSLTLNKQVREADIANFCEGLALDQQKFGLKLWGGDTTHTPGPNVLSVTIIGTVPSGETVKRSGAQNGDVVCVTGTIGDSHLGLKVTLNQRDILDFASNFDHWRHAYHKPDPPYKLRHGVRFFASAALDISDGLIADAGHLAKASNVSLAIDLDDIPLSRESSDWVNRQKDSTLARIALATGGDDYQVLLTVNPNKYDELVNISKACGVFMTQIGCVKLGKNVRVLDQKGDPLNIKKPGYMHFV